MKEYNSVVSVIVMLLLIKVICICNKIVEKMSVQAPRRSLVENYLVEIGKSHNIPYEPDPAAFLVSVEVIHINNT